MLRDVIVSYQEVQWDEEPGDGVQAAAGQVVRGEQKEQQGGTREGWARRDGARRSPPPSKEGLDKEIDSYMAGQGYGRLHVGDWGRC